MGSAIMSTCCCSAKFAKHAVSCSIDSLLHAYLLTKEGGGASGALLPP